MRVHSYAKLNWYLRVLDRRPDGYHNLQTVFETLSMADVLQFAPRSERECVIDGFPADVPADRNLIKTAWEILRREYPEQVGGLEVQADKRLPRGGGLGGGSSNAAAALLALDNLYNLRVPVERLVALGAELGSDVAFFVRGGCARAEGRGDILTPAEAPGEFHVILVLPDEAVPTGEAYAKLGKIPRSAPEGGMERVLGAVAANDAEELARCIHNDFELVVAEAPWFQLCREALERAGCLRSFLCGSGSTVAGLVRNGAEVKKILGRVHESCPYPAYHTTARALSLTG